MTGDPQRRVPRPGPARAAGGAAAGLISGLPPLIPATHAAAFADQQAWAIYLADFERDLARVDAIMALPGAASRPALARFLAVDTKLPISDCAAIFARALPAGLQLEATQ